MYCYGGYLPTSTKTEIPNIESLHSSIEVHRTLWVHITTAFLRKQPEKAEEVVDSGSKEKVR